MRTKNVILVNIKQNMEEDVAGEKSVSWNPTSRLRRFQIDDENILRPYERGARNSPPAPNATRQFTRHREVEDFERRYRGGVPCEVREELIAAFNVLGGLRKTIEVHKQVYQDKRVKDEGDTEIELDLIAAFRAARARAFELLRQCGFPKPLSFGKRLQKVLSDRNVSTKKRNKLKTVLKLLHAF